VNGGAPHAVPGVDQVKRERAVIGAAVAPSAANVSAVSNAPGTKTIGGPLIPQLRHRVSNTPPLTMSSPDGVGAGEFVARW
jgi:hypothetical protein